MFNYTFIAQHSSDGTVTESECESDSAKQLKITASKLHDNVASDSSEGELDRLSRLQSDRSIPKTDAALLAGQASNAVPVQHHADWNQSDTEGSEADLPSPQSVQVDLDLTFPRLQTDSKPHLPILNAAQSRIGACRLATEYHIPASINRFLRPYQRDGVRFFFERYQKGVGGILGDDMCGSPLLARP